MVRFPHKNDKIVLQEEPLIHERVVLDDVWLGSYTEIGRDSFFEHVQMGDYSYCGPDCIFQNTEIGKFANIAASVRIGPTSHPIERPTLHHFTYRRRMYGFDEHDDTDFFQRRESLTARIGHDTWIGHGAVIMPGIRIGTGAVIGSGAVVTHNIPDYSIAVGVPARVIKRRFSYEQSKNLKQIAWWNWSHEEIRIRMNDFCRSVDDFILKYLEKTT